MPLSASECRPMSVEKPLYSGLISAPLFWPEPGVRTNHSLRATSATRLCAANVDEQLVMERTGLAHRTAHQIII